MSQQFCFVVLRPQKKGFYSREKSSLCMRCSSSVHLPKVIKSAVSWSLSPWAWRSWRGGQYTVSWTAELSLRKGWSSSLGPPSSSAVHQLRHSCCLVKAPSRQGIVCLQKEAACKRSSTLEAGTLHCKRACPVPRSGCVPVPSLWAPFAFLLGQRALSHPLFFPH